MLKKSMIVAILAALSFFVLTMTVSAFSLKGLFGKKDDSLAEQTQPRVKMCLPTYKAEAAGKRIISKDKDNASLLYDAKLDAPADFDENTEVTIDMAGNVIPSSVRYYTGKIKEGGKNCLGTRFYGSKDNKSFVELGIISGEIPSENAWGELYFAGFDEYRYLKVYAPENSNLCEVEWLCINGVSQTKRAGLSLNLYTFDILEDIDATVLFAEYDKNGAIKNISSNKVKLVKGENTSVLAELKNAELKAGDSYRIIVFDEEGKLVLKNPLIYQLSGPVSEVTVSDVFTDNMLLQADKPLKIWGRAPIGTTVKVVIENERGGKTEHSVNVTKKPEWSIDMGIFSAGGRYTVKVKSQKSEIEYKNVTFGDVWLCTGQSNMEFYMAAAKDTAEELKNKQEVRNEEIRIYNMFNKGIGGAAMPLDNPATNGDIWRALDEETAAYCSSVAYYFAKEINQETGVPIGIINIAVGDTEINRWIENGRKCGSFTSTSGDLYNNRVYPFKNLNIKGILYYQGEADQYRTHLSADEYSDAMAGLVDSYRGHWGEDLPFYWAQLTRHKVDESLVREGQRLALEKVAQKKNTGMVTLIDIVGNYNAKKGSARDDIHPWDKKTVADRFSAYAKRDCYGIDTAVCGPVLKSVKRDGNRLVVTFDCEGKLRVMPKERYADKITDKKIKKEKLDVNRPQEFEIAGSSGEYFKADAVLDGKSVVLTCDSVSAPISVRYAWGAYPEMPNLTDDTGLPCPTFEAYVE